MWLKRWTPQNIVIGGAAGAFPPMIGEAVVTGQFGWHSLRCSRSSSCGPCRISLALVLVKSADRPRRHPDDKAGNVVGSEATRRQTLYSLIMAPVAVLPALMGFGGLLYLVVSVTTGLP